MLINSLPPEILVQIFIRLPVKSVLQICCVCKGWYSLISNPDFVSMHTRFTIATANNNIGTKTSPCYVIRGHRLDGRVCFSFMNYADENNSGVWCERGRDPTGYAGTYYVKLIGSCYGLLCLFTSQNKEITHWLPIQLWNPSVRKSLNLPVYPACGMEPIYAAGDFKIILGFGYDFKRSDYKIVRVIYGPRFDVTEIDVFELNVGVWTSIRKKFSRFIPFVATQISTPAFVNGAIHWIGYELDEGLRKKGKMIVVAFDVGEEEFKVLDMPDGIVVPQHESDGITCGLTVSDMGNSLRLINQETDVCHVWVMEEYGVVESWRKLNDVYPPTDCEKILSVWKNGDILLVNRDKKMVLHKPENESINSQIKFVRESLAYLDVNHVETLTLWK